MTNAGRGRRWDRVLRIAAVAALGLALSACGGGAENASAGASAAQSSTQADSPVPSQGSAPAQNTAAGAGSTSDQSTSTGTPTGSGSGDPPTASAGTVTINWAAPTENTDGTPLTNLAGYHIHYGTMSLHYTQTIVVSNPGIATYVVQSLTRGTYYFSVAAVNSAGTESPLSSEVRATVN